MKHVFHNFHQSLERPDSIMKNNIISKVQRINFQFLKEEKKGMNITNLCCLLLDWGCDLVIDQTYSS